MGTSNQYRIGILTFNQGDGYDSVETNKRLRALLTRWKKNDGQLPEIIVLTVQESKDDKLVKHFGDIPGYIKMSMQSFWQPSLGQLRILVCVQDKFHQRKQVSVLRSNTGYYKCAWAKGAVFVTLTVGQRILQFFGLHLPAAPNKPHLRDTCLLKILHASALPDAEVFIAGDWNYRVTPARNSPKRIEDRRCTWPPTNSVRNNTRYDQLSRSLKTSLKHLRLRESPVLFCQTCRLKTSGNLRMYDPKRYPSWCDRILSHTSRAVQGDEYAAWDLSATSDHFAVYQIFTVSDR